MKKTFLIATGLSLALAGVVYCAGVVYDASNFSADGRKWQPVPSGHIPGKDNGPGEGLHHSGEDCGICHKAGGKAANFVWSMSGTLYDSRAARTPLAGAEIVLQDYNGNVISLTTNEVGNFWTTAHIGSDPYTIASHGGVTDFLYYTDEQGVFHPTDPADARSWQYKGWVKSGDHVRPMVTIAPVGGSTDPNSRMSCNMHHASMGSRGGLWGAGTSTLASYPPSQLSLKKHILPIFMSKCVPCHIPGETWTRLVTRSDVEGSPVTKIDFSKMLDLTSYNGSAVTVSGTLWNKRGIKDMTVGYQDNPDASPVLAKTGKQPDGSMIHAGGAFWTHQDADFKAIRQWIAEGAQNN